MGETLRRAGLRPVLPADHAETVAAKLAGQETLEIEKTYRNWDESLQPVAIDEVIMGNVLSAGQGQNPARQAMIRAGLNKETPTFGLNKVCGSGLKAIAIAAQSIMSYNFV